MMGKLLKFLGAVAGAIGLVLALLSIGRQKRRAVKAETKATELLQKGGQAKLGEAQVHADKHNTAIEKGKKAHEAGLKNMDKIGASNDSFADLLSEWNAGDRLRD